MTHHQTTYSKYSITSKTIIHDLKYTMLLLIIKHLNVSVPPQWSAAKMLLKNITNSQNSLKLVQWACLGLKRLPTK